jgi:signal transduction histidine kinase
MVVRLTVSAKPYASWMVCIHDEGAARFQVVLDERVRLAREMHDTVLQGCASVSLLLEASSNADNDPVQRQAFMDCARGQISATMDEARRAVWNLRNSKEPSVDLPITLKQMIEILQSEFGKEIDCDIKEKFPWIDPRTAHEVVMVAREALYNALLHANAKQITLAAASEDMRAVLTISDDGKGFDVERPIPSGHYGLAGMRERIQNIGGEFQIQSEPGVGTCIAFTVRLDSAAGR